MGRGPFPTGDFGRRTSEGVIGGDIGAPSAGAAAGVAAAARGFGRELRDMSERVLKREGETDAARAVTAAAEFGQTPALRQGFGVDDQAYNGVMREHLLTQRMGVFDEELTKAEIANPDDVTRFTDAAGAVRQALRDKPTGDPLLDSAFEREAIVRTQASLRRVRQGQERTRVERVRGAYRDAMVQGETLLGQSIATAGFDDQGIELVGQGLTQFLERQVHWGPREAFSIGGVEFAADPSRLGAVGLEELTQQFHQTQLRARSAWLDNAVELSPDAASARAMVGQVQEQWAAGNPAFAGLDAQDINQIVARLDSTVNRKAVDEAAQVRAASSLTDDLLKAYEYGGDVDLEALRAAAVASGDVGKIAEVDYRIAHGFTVSPRTATGAVGAGFQGAADVLLDQLEGSGFVANDGGRGRSQWGVTEKSHPEFWADGKITRGEAVQVAREYWDGINGDSLPPDLAMAALAAAYVGGIETAKGFLAQAGGDVTRFMALEEARFRRLAGGDQAKLNGWLARQGKVRGALGQMAAQRRAQEGYVSDPLGFAAGTRTRPAMTNLPSVDPNAVFDGRMDEWVRGVRARRAVGQELARRDGVPARTMTNAEVAIYKAKFEQDPAAIVQFAIAAGTAGGGDGARQMLIELGRGGVAGGDVRLAQLAMDPHTRTIAQAAVQGRILRSQGATRADFGKSAAGKSNPGIAEVAEGLASAFVENPALLQNARQVAEDAAVADQARGQLRSAAYYVNSALGATTREGRRYGGPTEVNGAVTIAPSWLEADVMDEALELRARTWVAADRGPLFSNGQPIPARQLGKMQMKAMPNGRYQLVNPATGVPLLARSGSAFEFDMDADDAREALARSMPRSVRSR